MGFGHSQRRTREPDTFTQVTARPSSPTTAAASCSPASRRSAGSARTGRIPLGILRRCPRPPSKTFPEIDGQRVVIPGDRASLEQDGTIRLFGRDSLVVNTGGEKVFVEEVEEVLRAHPAIADALVVGRPERALGRRGRRARRSCNLAPTSPARSCTRSARPQLARSRRPRHSSSSTRSSASATARPTTGGRNERAARTGSGVQMTAKA